MAYTLVPDLFPSSGNAYFGPSLTTRLTYGHAKLEEISNLLDEAGVPLSDAERYRLSLGVHDIWYQEQLAAIVDWSARAEDHDSHIDVVVHVGFVLNCLPIVETETFRKCLKAIGKEFESAVFRSVLPALRRQPKALCFRLTHSDECDMNTLKIAEASVRGITLSLRNRGYETMISLPGTEQTTA